MNETQRTAIEDYMHAVSECGLSQSAGTGTAARLAKAESTLLAALAEPVQESGAIVKYQTGTPEQTGVYACRAEDPACLQLQTDKFMLWRNDRWHHPGTGIQFPHYAKVLGWIGPLSRMVKP